MPLVRYEVTGYGIALYGLTVEHEVLLFALLNLWYMASPWRCRSLR